MPLSDLHPAYTTLEKRHLRWYRLEHLGAIASWDRAVGMPEGASEARANALAELDVLLHAERTAPEVLALLDRVGRIERTHLDEVQRANLREMQRDARHLQALPEDLVARRTQATVRCEQAWRRLRPANDWAGFVPLWREVVALAREEAQHLAQASGLSPYDALLDRFEPGMRAERVEALFADLRTWLPALIPRVMAHQASAGPLPPRPHMALGAQRLMHRAVMAWLGFEGERGRLDESTHPFTGGVPEDVRLTTRLDEDRVLEGLLATIHETGHACYEQHLPRAWLGQPVGRARSMAIHESQSLAFEMQLARHPGVMTHLSQLLRQYGGDQPAFEPAALARSLLHVQPGLIRVDADELSYPLHIALRFDLERALISGEIDVEDVPAFWDARMAADLGLDTRGNFRDGPMQDVHWPEGLFGYFPCYTLGAMYAAQWLATLRRQQPDLDTQLQAGHVRPLRDWLAQHIWTQASRWETDELSRRASTEALNPLHFRRHLEGRYAP